jgi:prophage regulatory protein
MYRENVATPSFVRLSEVKNLTGLSRTTIYMLFANGVFPRPIRIAGVRLWNAREVMDWIAARTDASRRPAINHSPLLR